MPTNVMQGSTLLDDIRGEVRERLLQSPNFAALPEEERKSLAQNTVTALTYILGGEDGKSHP
ncbi:MAG TPA: hypothetical protein VLN48_04685, partial [Bryobacteraceae bacterium]|nr:hypothetical protein [Bryobacteraceae bacterium]